ncbi:MAG: hypothetical protein ACOX1N_06690 [Candidatus Methanomethylophilaceae archaeon]|jgi:hypothetical protein
MNNRTKFIVYFIGLFIVAAGTANLIADLIISDFNYSGEVVLPNMILVISG